MISSVEGRVCKTMLILSDLALVHLGYLIAYSILYNSFIHAQYINIAPWISGMFFLIFYLFNLYTDWKRTNFRQIVYTIVLSIGIFTILTIGAANFYSHSIFSLKAVMLAFVVQTILLIVSRFSIWQTARTIYGKKKVLIIAENEKIGLFLADKVLSHNKGWFIISSFLTLSKNHKLHNRLKETDIVLISPTIEKKQKSELIGLCNEHGKEVLIVPELFEIFVQGSGVQQVDDMLVFSIRPAKFSLIQRAVKRGFDLMAATILLMIASPIIIFLWILIPLTSRGPALFKQERIGRDEEPYQIYKFRSMVQDAEKNTGPILATVDDPRVTRIGRMIRSTRLDELPQLFNVLKGEMSLVGPRPERKFFIDQFTQEVTNYTQRLTVKPGVTGLAQVMAKYNTTVEDKLRFDLMYIRHYSLTLDIKIFLQTIRVMIQREQAEGVEEKNEQREEQLLQLLRENKAVGQ
ncbi:hypothetical protein AC623_02370 [Bacillus sp. FJAT-27231]|uniref:sugar transferase n=1 Tax=Bacillus sp. FJAT-27231 TaxID=1679168 RepID=UPI0006717D01|nr:sugar transferase [Bacillus sp. FJAT-27231]KMY52975.1 hypothetical protein AC623_02370 [Bacillus sp. FJAT-27231]